MPFRVRDSVLTRSALSAPPGEGVRLLEANALLRDDRLAEAELVFGDLIVAEPNNSEAWYQQGNLLRRLSRLPEALVSYQRALDLAPRHTRALCNRSVVLLALGRADEAASGLERAIEIDPNDAIARYNLGVAEQALGQKETALVCYEKAIQLDPDHAEAYFCRGRMHEDAGRWDEAVNDYDRALALRPGLSLGNLHRGNVLAQMKRWQDALASYDVAVMQEQDNVVAHIHRGNVLRHLGCWDDALESYNRAIALQPDKVDGYFNRGVIFEQLKQFAAAIASYERVIDLDPQFAPARYNRATVLLATGDFARGLPDYEWRWKNRDASFDPASYHGSIPLWFGRESLENRSILVFSEQGLGDTLQFCRYIKLLAERGACVIFEVQQPLVGLLAGVEGASMVISRGDAIPYCDYKCALLSLPLALETNVETIPSADRYLNVDAARVSAWKSRLGTQVRPRVGLVWSGNQQMPNDHQRSMPLATLVKYLPPGCDYFCLQKDIREADRATLAANPFIVDQALNFIDVAAMCECMDVVVSVCTSLAHLAGALGRPLWLLLAYNADWRWLEDRQDTPWYPSARLYRQKTIGDWGQVAARVGGDLRRQFDL